MKRKSIFGICIGILLLLSSFPVFATHPQTNQERVICYASHIHGMKKINEKELSNEKLNELESQLTNIFNGNIAEEEIDITVNEILETLRSANILPEDFNLKQVLPVFRKKEWGWGILNYVVSYGRGEIYIPLKSDRSFLRLLLRPIFFKYNLGFTVTKFGATYMWDSNNVVGNIGFMLGRQRGFMIGFMGLHVRIPHKLKPDSHLFIGGVLIINGNNLLF